jgi:nitroreductase
MTTLLELAAARYSVRDYKPDPVQAELMAKVLEAGRLAPTACNKQPQRIKVISDFVGLQTVDRCTPCRFGAPAVILVCYDKTACWSRGFDGASSGEIDASIAASHMMLAAHDLGLGTCWVMHFDPDKLSMLLELPKTIVPVAMLPVGYPAVESAPAAGHSSRLPIESILL